MVFLTDEQANAVNIWHIQCSTWLAKNAFNEILTFTEYPPRFNISIGYINILRYFTYNLTPPRLDISTDIYFSSDILNLPPEAQYNDRFINFFKRYIEVHPQGQYIDRLYRYLFFFSSNILILLPQVRYIDRFLKYFKRYIEPTPLARYCHNPTGISKRLSV